MEETLIPDVIISNSHLTIGGKTYSLYCKRKTKNEAEAIKNDLIRNNFDALVRRTMVDYHTCYLVWWRKN